MVMSYTGIGSRKTPDKVLRAMESVGKFLATQGVILRSGGAEGADMAFERGCDLVSGPKEIFLPWKGFNDNKSPYFRIGIVAYEDAKRFHPKWESLTEAGKKLMARNVYQVLGENQDNPSDFLICWTEEGKLIGGTSQAIRIANHYKIPVFNLGNQSMDNVESMILEILKNNTPKEEKVEIVLKPEKRTKRVIETKTTT